MNQKIKLGLYAAFIISAAVFGALFYSSYRAANKPAPPAPTTNVAPALPSAVLTNALTNPAGTNQVASTNTNAATNTAAMTNDALEPIPTSRSVQTAATPSRGHGAMISYLFAFVVIAIFLGLLIARDISEYFGSRSVEFMFNDEGTGIKDPDYEEAEQEWANGHHLEAIRLMREYLEKNPREQGVALRIAEIYEKDLKNTLAAALEYEEVLKHKLPAERWGWAAIHLCNLYSKMGKTNDAVALLRRIDSEYSETAAAKKARQRLALFETVGEEALTGDLPESLQAEPPPKPAKLEEKSAPASNLPPGFRPKDK